MEIGLYFISSIPFVPELAKVFSKSFKQFTKIEIRHQVELCTLLFGGNSIVTNRKSGMHFLESIPNNGLYYQETWHVRPKEMLPAKARYLT